MHLLTLWIFTACFNPAAWPGRRVWDWCEVDAAWTFCHCCISFLALFSVAFLPVGGVLRVHGFADGARPFPSLSNGVKEAPFPPATTVALMCCVVICAVCAACVLIYYAPSGCFDCCVRCIGAVPYPSLVATLLCYAGTALFCGCGHEALAHTEVLIEAHFARNAQDYMVLASLWVMLQSMQLFETSLSQPFHWRLPVTFPSIKYFQYVIYGLASFFFLYGILLLAEGFYTTSAVKQTFGEFRSTHCGRCLSLTVRTQERRGNESMTSGHWRDEQCWFGLSSFNKRNTLWLHHFF